MGSFVGGAFDSLHPIIRILSGLRGDPKPARGTIKTSVHYCQPPISRRILQFKQMGKTGKVKLGHFSSFLRGWKLVPNSFVLLLSRKKRDFKVALRVSFEKKIFFYYFKQGMLYPTIVTKFDV